MSEYDFDRPFVDASTLPVYATIDRDVARRYGQLVRAAELSNSEYGRRYQRMSAANNMKAPPSHHRIFGGYLVVRRLGTPDQYETWMPDHAFAEIYRLHGSEE